MWKTKEFVDIPEDVLKKTEGVKIEEKRLKIKSTEIFYQEFVPSSGMKSIPVLMLHGASFTSQTWVDIGTFQLLAAMGHRVVAIDLPGFGKSNEGSGLKLKDFIEEVNLDRPAIVSPSMSGGKSIPYIFSDPETWAERARAFVPVAPVGTSRTSSNEYKMYQIPTMHVVGRRDTVEGKIGYGAIRDLSALSNIETVILEDAGHACYMNQTDKWHRLIYNFFTLLENA